MNKDVLEPRTSNNHPTPGLPDANQAFDFTFANFGANCPHALSEDDGPGQVAETTLPIYLTPLDRCGNTMEVIEITNLDSSSTTEVLQGACIAAESMDHRNGNGFVDEVLDRRSLYRILREAEEHGANLKSKLGTSSGEISEAYWQKVSRSRPKVTSLQLTIGDGQNGTKAELQCSITCGSASDLNLSPLVNGEVRWIDIESADEEILMALKTTFLLDPKAITDCLSEGIFAKHKPCQYHEFAVINSLSATRENEDALLNVSTNEVHTFIGKGFIITVHSKPNSVIDEFMQEMSRQPQVYASKSPVFLFCTLAEKLMASNSEIITSVREEVTKLYNELFKDKPGLSSESAQTKLPLLMRTVLTLKDSLADEEVVIKAVTLNTGNGKSEDSGLNRIVKGITSDLRHFLTKLDSMRRDLQEIQTTHEMALNRESNKILKRFAVLGGVSLPVTAVASIFGMNFEAIPFDSKPLFFGAMTAAFVVSSFLMIKAYKDKWIS